MVLWVGGTLPVQIYVTSRVLKLLWSNLLDTFLIHSPMDWPLMVEYNYDYLRVMSIDLPMFLATQYSLHYLS